MPSQMSYKRGAEREFTQTRQWSAEVDTGLKMRALKTEVMLAQAKEYTILQKLKRQGPCPSLEALGSANTFISAQWYSFQTSDLQNYKKKNKALLF